MPDPDYDPTEWNPSDDPTDYPEFWGDGEAASHILDKVMDGEASDAKEAIRAALYRKVGERIDGLRMEFRKDTDLSGLPSDDALPADAVSGDIPFGNDEDDDTAGE
jgi:hypothetical protein